MDIELERVASRWAGLGVVLPKLVIAICSAGMAAAAGIHLSAVAGLMILGCSFALADYFGKLRAPIVPIILGGFLTLLIPYRMLFGDDVNYAANLPRILCAVWAWGMAVSVLPLVPPTRPPKLSVSACAAIACGLTSASLWIGTAYAEALRGAFYLGVPAMTCLIILLKRFFTSVLAIQAANTCILLFVGIPAVDLFWKPPEPAPLPSVAQKFYSYELARKDPVAFERWWHFFTRHSNKMVGRVLQEDPRRLAPARTIPGAEATLFNSHVVINEFGFRGREIAREKRDAYRIIALGESTTFGFTLARGDRPWPEVLEDLIADRVGFSRKIEVINAGLPSFTIRDNLRRFAADIAPVKPDMILSYHGYNGFHFLDDSIPAPSTEAPPKFRPRALRMLEQAEYRAKIMLYRRNHVPEIDTTSVCGPVMSTKFAEYYRRLHQVANQHDARLVLASFSMAVNEKSDPDVVEFYQLGFPAVSWSIKANSYHTELVRSFAESHPDVLYVDTRPGLDGHHEKFIDLVHLTQEGRNQIAEAFYAAIEPVLRKEIGQEN